MSISLVLPCYNPPDGWAQTICSNYLAFQQQAGEQVELIVVMDGTGGHVYTDALDYLEKNIAGLKVVQYSTNRGKGYAIRQGVKIATGDIIVYTDVDFPYTTESMLAVYEPLSKDLCDVAVGVKNDDYYTHVPPLRRLISRYLRFFIRLFLSMPITDTQCGLKGFRKPVSPLFLETTIDRYLFDLEFIRNCFKSKKYRMQAVPVTLKENIHFRSMNYRILLPEMLNFIKLLFK
jgi:glycosyltransferase involved in cell wall biosynthesis